MPLRLSTNTQNLLLSMATYKYQEKQILKLICDIVIHRKAMSPSDFYAQYVLLIWEKALIISQKKYVIGSYFNKR